MKKEITVTLTSKEIESLQISICSQKIILQEEIERLSKGNKTGINTQLINKKRILITKLDDLFTKLYTAKNRVKNSRN